MAIVQQRNNTELIRTPNRVLEIDADLTAYQLKIYITILDELRELTERSFADGKAAIKWILEKDVILLSIPLRKISKPTEYRDVKKSLLKMSKIECEITYYKHDKKQIMSGSLFTVDMPIKANWKSVMKITLHPQVAMHMLIFQLDAKGTPVYYSQINPNIVRSLKGKHTIRLYMLLCLWRNKGRIRISVDKLYHFLQISSKYKSFPSFKREVLCKAAKDLAEQGDIWFDIDDPNFFVKEGNKVVRLDFKVVNKELAVSAEKHRNSIKELLRSHWGFNAQDFAQIRGILEDVPYHVIMNKIHFLYPKLTPEVKNQKRYIITSLMQEFKDHIK